MNQERYQPKPGWLKRQLERVKKEAESYPPWLVERDKARRAEKDKLAAEKEKHG